MDKNEILKQMEQLQNQVDNLKCKLEKMEKPQTKRWRANKGCVYYSSCEEGGVEMTDEREKEDDYYYAIGDYFETIEQAEIYNENLITKQQLKDLAIELNNGVEIDWKNGDQNKYYIYIDYDELNHFECGHCANCMDSGVVYCLDELFRDKALELIGANKLIQLFESGV